MKYRPETLESLRRRGPLAIEETLSFQDLLELVGSQEWANGPPVRNIFDFDDGVRIIITRVGDLSLHPSPMIHASMSFIPLGYEGAKPMEWVRELGARHGPGPDMAKCEKFIRDRVAYVLYDATVVGDVIESIVMPGKGVPHVFLSEK